MTEALEREERGARFREEVLEGRGGPTRVRVLEDGEVLERAASLLTRTRGAALPPAATERRPELAGRPYEAASSSLIVHPRNPYAPTCHANFRFFAVETEREPVSWFGGGYDLTPIYGFEEDARHWHATARAACEPFGADVHPRLKRACDAYFHLPHRGEQRGVGGVFFDDLGEDFERDLELWRAIGESFVPAYLPILARRKGTPHGERERRWQCLRRGRYVEFNLLHDRGTRFGLEAGGRAESILCSMPPLASWRHGFEPEPGSAEARLAPEFLRPRDWLAEG